MRAAPTRTATSPGIGPPAAVPPTGEPDAAAADIEKLAFQAPVERAPWHVRNSRWLIATAATVGTLTAGTLGYGVWRNLATTPLDEIAIPPHSRTAVRPSPSKSDSASKSDLAIGEARVPHNEAADTPPVTAFPAAERGTAARANAAYSARGVTHTRSETAPRTPAPARQGGPATSKAPPSRSSAQADGSSSTCSEPVAALGLCTQGQTKKDE